MQGHETIVIGWNSSGEVTFVRTFDFGPSNNNEKELVMIALDYVQKNCNSWRISRPSSVLSALYQNDDY